MKRIYTFLIVFILCVSVKPQGWQWQNPYPQGNFQSDIWTLDSSTIIILGDYGTVIKSTDAGNAWKINYIGGDSIFYSYDLQFADGVGWAITGNFSTPRYIFKSLDIGGSWIINTKFDDEVIQSLYFINETTGWLIGYSSSSFKGKIFKTDDGGKIWSDQSPDSIGILNDVFFLIQNMGLLSATMVWC